VSELSLDDAVARLRAGGLVGYPTETVWGLGADPRNARALAELRRWKGRDAQKPMAVLVEGVGALSGLGAKTTRLAERLAARFWPGPLTLIVDCAAFAPGLAAEDGGVGFRCSPHPVASALARAAGPVTATSLNRSGAPACATRAEASDCAGAQIPLIDGPDAGRDSPSSVVDARGAQPRVLREGAIPTREIERAAREGARG
jgi:L-threonylcarbamoyladenylate synthase